MKVLKKSLVLLLVAATCGCAGMSQRQQTTLSGGAIGAGGGALLGAITGGSPAVGAAVGVRPALWAASSSANRKRTGDRTG